MRAYNTMGLARSNSSLSSSLFVQAMTAFHQHKFGDAEAMLLRWLAVHPGDRDARYNLLLVRRDLSTAQILRLLAVAPDSYHVHQLLGQLYVGREEDEKALAEYRAVAAARPDLPGVHFWLGHLYWEHGDADHALAELTLIEPVVKSLGSSATLHPVKDADHSFHVLARSGRNDGEVMNEILDAFVAWAGAIVR